MHPSHKKRIIEILATSFKENKSTNFVIKQDHKKEKRLRTLIKYSIYYGEKFGEVHLSEDQSACYITIDTSKKKVTLGSMLWDIRLIIQCIGLTNLKKVMKREKLIHQNHPNEDFIHLWYIGVDAKEQGNGKGTELLQLIIQKARALNKSIYLETSTERNFKFYTASGFKETTVLDQLGYSIRMYCLD